MAYGKWNGSFGLLTEWLTDWLARLVVIDRIMMMTMLMGDGQPGLFIVHIIPVHIEYSFIFVERKNKHKCTSKPINTSSICYSQAIYC